MSGEAMRKPSYNHNGDQQLGDHGNLHTYIHARSAIRMSTPIASFSILHVPIDVLTFSLVIHVLIY
jgi:hypothetical protein